MIFRVIINEVVSHHEEAPIGNLPIILHESITRIENFDGISLMVDLVEKASVIYQLYPHVSSLNPGHVIPRDLSSKDSPSG